MRLSTVNLKAVELTGYDMVLSSNPAGCASCEGLLVRPTSANDEEVRSYDISMTHERCRKSVGSLEVPVMPLKGHAVDPRNFEAGMC